MTATMPGARRLISLALWLAATAPLALTACEDLNEMFQGLWKAEDVYPLPVEGIPEIALGHYGQEVAGVVYFRVKEGTSGYVDGCQCGFVEHQSLDLDARSVLFVSRCVEGGPPYDWRLHIRDDGTDTFLEGEVRPSDGSAEGIGVSLRQERTTLREDEKECPPGQ